MLLSVTASKKIPRFLLAGEINLLSSLSEVQALWPDKSESIIYDLSLSGMATSTNGRLSRVKPQESMEFRLRVKGYDDYIPVKARLVRIHSQYFGFLFESMSVEGRLVIDQLTKDRVIIDSIHEASQSSLLPQMRCDLWLHGAFDTNLLMWKSSDGESIEKALIEYENLIWCYDQGELSLLKSASAVEESQSYFNHHEVFARRGKVSMGASWPDRLQKCLEKIQQQHSEIEPLVQLFLETRKR